MPQTTQPDSETAPPANRPVTRRGALASLGILGIGSLAGCLGALGAEPVDSDGDRSGGNGTQLGNGDDRVGQTQVEPSPSSTPTDAGETADGGTPELTTSAESADGLPKGPGVMPDVLPTRRPSGDSMSRFVPVERVFVGPVTSPATNDWNPHYDDPEPGKKLTDVTVRNSTPEDWVVSPPGTGRHPDGLKLTVNRDGAFVVEGGLHYHNECGYFGVNQLYVRKDIAAISLAYGHNPTCTDSDFEEGSGYWYGSVSVTGRLEGDFDLLRITLLNGRQNSLEIDSSGTMEFDV